MQMETFFSIVTGCASLLAGIAAYLGRKQADAHISQLEKARLEAESRLEALRLERYEIIRRAAAIKLYEDMLATQPETAADTPKEVDIPRRRIVMTKE